MVLGNCVIMFKFVLLSVQFDRVLVIEDDLCYSMFTNQMVFICLEIVLLNDVVLLFLFNLNDDNLYKFIPLVLNVDGSWSKQIDRQPLIEIDRFASHEYEQVNNHAKFILVVIVVT